MKIDVRFRPDPSWPLPAELEVEVPAGWAISQAILANVRHRWPAGSKPPDTIEIHPGKPSGWFRRDDEDMVSYDFSVVSS